MLSWACPHSVPTCVGPELLSHRRSRADCTESPHPCGGFLGPTVNGVPTGKGPAGGFSPGVPTSGPDKVEPPSRVIPSAQASEQKSTEPGRVWEAAGGVVLGAPQHHRGGGG